MAALGPGPALLVLDNCEHVVRGAADLVHALVSLSKDLRVLTTSRAPLGLSSESVYLLPELDLATTAELFGQRARAARPDADLPASAVRELCGRLDGLPLAAELAAARVRVMSVAEIARRLDDRFAVLRGGARDAPQRHRTLHAVIDWSWNLLDPAGQAAMRALSVFPGGFTADAARHLLGADILPVLEQLADQSLLKVADTASGTRYRMLETVREFAAARREDAGETERVTGRFLAWARDFGVAHHDSVLTGDDLPAFELVRAEQDNLVQALRHGLDREDAGTVAAVSAVLGGLWMVESSFARLIGPGAGHGPDPAAVPAGNRPRRGHPDQPGARRRERVPAAGTEPGAVPGGPASAAARSAGHLRPGRAGRAERAGRSARGGPRDPAGAGRQRPAAGRGHGQLRGQLRPGRRRATWTARWRRRGGRSPRSSAVAAPGSGPPRMPGSANCASSWTRPARATRRCVT